jgi:hypothetical protein
MFYTFKNTKISFNGRDLIAESASISHSSSIEAFYEEDDRNSQRYTSSAGINGSFRVRYYLTGEDFLKDYISNELPVSGNFAGMYFPLGYIQSYNIQGEANSPTLVDINGVFFDSLDGSFSANYEDISKTIDFYNNSDTSISLSVNGIGSISEINSYSYSVNNEISPVFYENSTIPDRIYFGKRTVEASFSSSNLSTLLNLTGNQCEATIDFYNQNGNLESYAIVGTMYSKDYSSSVGSKLSSTINIVSENYQDSPVITSFDPVPSLLSAGDSVTINGSNLLNTRRIVLDDREFSNFSIVNDSEIIANIPSDAISGNLTLFGYGGSYSTGFAMPDGAISISSISPSSGIYGETFSILGSNLYRISEVRLSASSYSTECTFEEINTSTLNVEVPDNFGGHGLSVDVYSSGLGRGTISGSLADSFNMLPQIVDFTPTGYAGSLFVVVTNGHQGFDKIVFNDGPSYDTAGDIVYNELSGIIPEGDTFGRIKIYNTTDNVFVESVNSFYPLISVNSISPTSGQEGASISITGQNFNTGLMYNTSPSNYLVDFNGITGEMEWVSNSGLVGTMVDMVTSGPIRIFSSDGITLYPSSVNFDFIPPNINLTGIDSLTLSGDATSNNKIKILGENLGYVDSVYLTKTNNPSIGVNYDILSGNGTGIGVGLLGNIVSFYISGSDTMPTGTYSITASDLYSSDSISTYTLY